MGCCDSIIRYVVFLFNFVFFMTSIALIAIGAYIQIHMKQYLDFLSNTYLNTSIILIIIGGVMLVVTFFGCCGACTENPCMMYTYGTMLALILLSLVGVAITIYVFKDDVKEVIQKGMGDGMKNYKQESFEGVTETWDIIQADFKCCGVQTFKDWIATPYGSGQDVPDTCCRLISDGCGKGQGAKSEAEATVTIYTKGCFAAFEDEINGNVAAAAGVGVGVAVLLFLGVLIACCVARNLREKNNYV